MILLSIKFEVPRTTRLRFKKNRKTGQCQLRAFQDLKKPRGNHNKPEEDEFSKAFKLVNYWHFSLTSEESFWASWEIPVLLNSPGEAAAYHRPHGRHKAYQGDPRKASWKNAKAGLPSQVGGQLGGGLRASSSYQTQKTYSFGRSRTEPPTFWVFQIT